MAKTSQIYVDRGKIVRRGVHSKNKHSWNKNSKNYKKKYRGQGRP